MAFVLHTKETKVGSYPSQVSAMTVGYILEGQSTKRRGQTTDKTGINQGRSYMAHLTTQL